MFRFHTGSIKRQIPTQQQPLDEKRSIKRMKDLVELSMAWKPLDEKRSIKRFIADRIVSDLRLPLDEKRSIKSGENARLSSSSAKAA